MNKIILTLALFISFLGSYSQIKISDHETHNSISNVKIFSKEGRILASSDLKGVIKISEIDFPQKDSIEVYHSNYISKKMIWNDLIKETQINLSPAPVTKLEEVVLSVKKLAYVMLKGYFISYQIIDDTPVSFSDGIIEYYINLDKEKIIDTRVVESRTFKNIKFIENGNSTSNLSTIPPFSFSEEVLLSDWNKFEILKNGIIKKKNNTIGKIATDSTNTEFTIEYYSPRNTKKTALLGIKSVIKNKTIYERFNSTVPKLEKITTIGKYYNSDITQKGTTKNYELIQDFHTLEYEFLNNKQLKERLSTNTQSNLYKGDKLTSVIPKYIESLLFEELELLSK